MDANLYQSPASDETPDRRSSGRGEFVRHRTFTHKSSFRGLTMSGARETLREQAEEFINTQVGADNIVSIVEHDSPPSVVVWYRE